jgi:hypothetical protein
LHGQTFIFVFSVARVALATVGYGTTKEGVAEEGLTGQTNWTDII